MALIAGLVLAAAFAGAARAATVSITTYDEWVDGGLIAHADAHYEAAAGEANVTNVQLSPDPDMVAANPVAFQDYGATIEGSTALTVPFPGGGTIWRCDANGHSASCSSAPDPVANEACDLTHCEAGTVPGFSHVFVDLGDGNDHLGMGGTRPNAPVVISLGAGNDVVQAKDGIPETIDCGSGIDWAHVDPYDVLSGCELVVTST